VSTPKILLGRSEILSVIGHQTHIIRRQPPFVNDCDINIIGIMRAALYYQADFSRLWYDQFGGNVYLDIVQARSYNAMEQNDNVEVYLSVSSAEWLTNGKPILILDTFIDTGRTMAKVWTIINDVIKWRNNPPPIFCASLYGRPSGVAYLDEQNIPSYVVARFYNDPEWLVGYGLDGKEGTMRALPFVAAIPRE
jgi:hypoxanthine-guanine phosphoribosyltransferase